MPATLTLKARVTAELEANTWAVPEIARQLGCGERMVFMHFRQGLQSRLINGKRRSTPAEVEQYIRDRLSLRHAA
jgi:hypothetical protein